MTRILLADDHVAVRDGIRAVLADQRDLEVVGEAVDGPSTIAAARTLRPDLIVLDNSMPGLSGLDVARMLRDELPWTGIVMLTMDPGIRDLALAAGATAFVTKDAPSDELIHAIRASALALVVRRNLNDLQPRWRRVLELLVGSRAATETQIHNALAQRGNGESFVMTLLRLGLLGQPELADVLARASQTPLVSLAPYPEVAAPIDPTEQRLSSPRLLDPVERAASRLLPLDVARPLGIVVIASDGREGVLAMADPLDDAALSEAERHTRLRLTRVTATLDEIQDALARAFSSAAPDPVVWIGKARGVLATVMVMGLVAAVLFGGFFYLVRDALAPRFAFSLFALLCGLFFFLYALKYYVTIASVLLITLFGDPARFGRYGNGHATTGEAAIGGQNGNGLRADGHTKGNGHATGRHKEGYRTLRGENLSAGGAVVVTDPWQKIGEIRLPADRQPFVSIHLALYNESRVVERLLTACTAFDYENYEVIVADDSTDETVELLKRWQNHPRVRVIHRSNRKGFKGGALQEALRRMNPKTEYVMVFDADFVPPADAIWHFLDYFGRLSKKNGNGHGANGHNGHGGNGNGHGAPQNGDRLAVVQGYQWHMLNASENWITKGVRAEFSGSYVLERSGQELFGAMKMISGSVYMIRADVLRKLGWSTSITEDWELTIRLYLAGYKVLYTPYIQAPAECVSTVSRLIKQRMRWAEGHTYNVKKYFWPVLRSPNLSWQEKLEFVYYAPYYLQSVLFSVATLAWIVGVLILGQKLPMWGEVFGWSLVVSNALALPLMNLTGVLMEGSLRRDVFGLLSFIGLSWILVPFQAYASVKALFEKREGGWVRTPKSGRVTEVLERFHLARLMPWELPKRRRGLSKPTSGSGRVAAAAVVVLAAAGIITVGALSIRAAATSGITSETDLAVPALIGTAVPLLVLALGWLRLRRRVTAVVLAFTLGLGTNVVYLANAVPASAVTDNSSVFMFKRTTAFDSPNLDMVQNYTPSGASTTCPAAATYNWTCAWVSDSFSAGQTLNAGTAQVDLYANNTNGDIVRKAKGGIQHTSSQCGGISIQRPAVVNGDVLVMACTYRGGTGITVTSVPPGWTAAGAKVDNGTTIGLIVYTHVVTDAASEPTTYTWGLSASVKVFAYYMNFSGVDQTNTTDGEANQATPSDTSHTALGVTTTVANDLVLTFHSTANCVNWTQPGGMEDVVDSAGCSNGATSNVDIQISQLELGASGPTGPFIATNDGAAVAVTKTIALRKNTAAVTCDLTVSVMNPVQYRSTTSNATADTTSLVITKPTGVQDGDVMVATIGTRWTTGFTITAPAGWTLVGSGPNGACCQMSIYTKPASAEPASYTWTFSGSTAAAGGISAYWNVDTVTTYDVQAGNAGSGLNPTTPTITTTQPAEMLVVSFMSAAIGTWTPPAGMTERFDRNASGALTASVTQADVIQTAAGAVSKTATITASSSGSTHIVALKSAAGHGNLGSTVVGITSPATNQLLSPSISLPAVTFASGDHLRVDVVAENDQLNCSASVSYDGASEPSKLTVATIVPEGVAGLLLLAPALPVGLRWWKRRRP